MEERILIDTINSIELDLNVKESGYVSLDYNTRMNILMFIKSLAKENLTKHNYRFSKDCPPHERCLLKSGLNPIYGCRKCRLPEDKWEVNPSQN